MFSQMQQRTTAALLSLLAGTALTAVAQTKLSPASNPNALFQVSTLDALLQGVYNGTLTVGQLKRHGDFGLGTFEGLDGELIAVNGHVYHMRSTGVLSEAA